METLEILALTLISITILKLFLLGATKESWQRFTNIYVKSITENHWLYFTMYFSISLFCLYLIRTTSLLTYTQILAVSMFVAFLINSGLTAMPSIYENFNFLKINKVKITLYTLVWFYIMYKAIKEIFYFNIGA